MSLKRTVYGSDCSGLLKARLEVKMTPLIFPSKVDRWIQFLLIFTAVSPLGPWLSAVESGDTEIIALSSFALLLVWGILWGLAWPIVYTVGEEQIEIRYGRVRSTILLSDIQTITPSRSLISSPALSLDRLQIETASGSSPLISPLDKPGFLAAVAEGAEHLVLDGDRLVQETAD